MSVIQSVVVPDLNWRINNSDNLNSIEIDFIEQLDQPIFFNDHTGKLWSFDVKMPSGRWLENITFTNDICTAYAFVAPKEGTA